MLSLFTINRFQFVCILCCCLSCLFLLVYQYIFRMCFVLKLFSLMLHIFSLQFGVSDIRVPENYLELEWEGVVCARWSLQTHRLNAKNMVILIIHSNLKWSEMIPNMFIYLISMAGAKVKSQPLKCHATLSQYNNI